MIVDLYAGPRGWSEGLRMLGRSDIGIELDRDACATAIAAGHATIRADVGSYPSSHFGPVDGVIASPPCPAFSMAGDGRGRKYLDAIVAHVHREEWGALRDLDPGAWLSLDVGRWVTDLNPRWVALEQVPPLLPVWEGFARVLERRGYSTWAGVLSAETFGVPQTRRRAVMIASLDRVVSSPVATHQHYESGVMSGDPSVCDSLFGSVQPWVSMAEALGWGMTRRPYFTVAVGTKSGGADPAALGGSAARAALQDERASGSWKVDTGNQYTVAGQTVTYARDVQPSPTLTGNSGAGWTLHPAEGHSSQCGPDTIKLSMTEGLLLQSFRPDYPVVGNKTSSWQQIGNAVPPLLARAVLAEAMGIKG